MKGWLLIETLLVLLVANAIVWFVVEKMRAITADDILRVARRIVQAGKLVLAVVGPDVEREELAELLAATAD